MKKIKYLTPILGLTAMVGVATPIATSCAKATTSTILPYNLLDIDGVTLKGLVAGTDLTKYDTIIIPEGVKYIAESAFDNDVQTTTDYSTIKTLKLPASLREMEDYAFYSLDKLTNIDLTSWDNDTIHYIEIGEWAFGDVDDNQYRSCKVNFAEGLSDEQLNVVKDKLSNESKADSIPDWWYIDQTTGHIGATDGVAKTANAVMTNATGGVYKTGDKVFSLTLTDTFDTTKYKLEVIPQITATTSEDDEIDEFYVEEAPADFKTLKFGLDINTKDKAESAHNHEINFDLNVVCRRIDDESNKVMWTEKVEGFKTTNVYTYVTGIEITNKPKEGAPYEAWLYADPRKLQEYKSVDPDVTYTPANCVNKEVVWSSEDSSIVKVEENAGKYTIYPANQGTTYLNCMTTDPTAAYDSVQIDVVGTYLEESDQTSTIYTEDAGSLRSYVGYDASLKELRYGYTLPAHAVVRYQVVLNGKCTGVYDGAIAKAAGGFRTFGVWENRYNGGSNENICLTNVKSATMKVIHSDETEVTLEQGVDKDYQLIGGKIYLSNDTIARPDTVFVAGDTLDFTFYLDNSSSIQFTGFEYHILK